MNLDYFRAAEKTLSCLPKLRSSLPILEKRLEKLMTAGAPKAPGGVDFSKPYVGSHHVNDTLNELLAVTEVQKEIYATKMEIDEIEKALLGVPLEQQKVVRLFYIEGHSAEAIAEQIFVESEKTVYHLRNQGVANFALLYYGALAEVPSLRVGKK